MLAQQPLRGSVSWTWRAETGPPPSEPQPAVVLDPLASLAAESWPAGLAGYRETSGEGLL